MNRLKVLTGARLCRFVPSGQSPRDSLGISPSPNDSFDNIKENKIEIQSDIYKEIDNEEKK